MLAGPVANKFLKPILFPIIPPRWAGFAGQ